jgi:hypothetical protein
MIWKHDYGSKVRIVYEIVAMGSDPSESTVQDYGT